jgi:hypothetical protein
MTIDTERTAHRVDLDTLATVTVLGPTLGYITPVVDDDAAPCVMRGEIPPGGIVGLHSHAEPETFVMLSGDAEAALRAFIEMAERYGHWIAGPEENAAVVSAPGSLDSPAQPRGRGCASVQRSIR